jgi:hypothetical protein
MEKICDYVKNVICKIKVPEKRGLVEQVEQVVQVEQVEQRRNNENKKQTLFQKRRQN